MQENEEKVENKNLPWSHPNYKPENEEEEDENDKNDDGNSKKKEDFWFHFKDITKDQIKHQPLSKNIGLYQFTEEDKNNPYFKDKLEIIKDYI